MTFEKSLVGIKKFFKNNATVGRKVYDLYNAFKLQFPSDKLTHEEFEQALLILKKKCALILREKCLHYVKTNGPDSYDKFTREIEFVSKETWDRISNGTPLQETPLKGKFGFVVSKKNGTETAPKTSLKKTPSLKDRDGKFGIIASKSEEDSIESDTEDKYFKLLPMNWTTMDFSERINFTKKVQHVGFFNYILNGEKKLKNYFARLNLAGPERTKLYVTIFSIPSDSYSEEAKSLLRTFVNSLNMTGRARLQYIQCSEPDMIEIREVR